MDNYFCFAGKRSTDFGVFVERFPTQEKPIRQVELVSVPGRNGSLRLDKGNYENVAVAYECYCRGGPDKMSEIADWLYAAEDGYAELRDTYHPGVFRMAAFDGPLSMENFWNQRGRFTIQFDCKPQLWRDDGQRVFAIDIPDSPRLYQTKIYNPTSFESKPLFCIFGSGNVSINVNNMAFSITNLPDGLYIDSEMQNAYIGNVSYNSRMSSHNGFPVLAPGENEIAVSGQLAQSVTRIEIVPRWWTM